MKAYKIELFIIDFDGLGKDEVETELQNANFPNDCIYLKIKDIKEADIGQWHDDHPLNKVDTCEKAYKELDFK